MYQSRGSNALLMAIMGAVVLGGPNARLRLSTSDGGDPLESTPEELAARNKGNNDGQLHRFVIRGQEIWARNKKAALRKANQ